MIVVLCAAGNVTLVIDLLVTMVTGLLVTMIMYLIDYHGDVFIGYHGNGKHNVHSLYANTRGYNLFCFKTLLQQGNVSANSKF